jgi:hypothetical protein
MRSSVRTPRRTLRGRTVTRSRAGRRGLAARAAAAPYAATAFWNAANAAFSR